MFSTIVGDEFLILLALLILKLTYSPFGSIFSIKFLDKLYLEKNIISFISVLGISCVIIGISYFYLKHINHIDVKDSFYIRAFFLNPILEEIIFRGIIFITLYKFFSFNIAVFVSSLLFGIGHPLKVGAFLIGCYLTLIFKQSRSLTAPIIFHSLYNILLLSLGYSLDLVDKITGKHLDQNPVFMNLTIIFVGACLFLAGRKELVKLVKENWNNEDFLGIKESSKEKLSH